MSSEARVNRRAWPRRRVARAVAESLFTELASSRRCVCQRFEKERCRVLKALHVPVVHRRGLNLPDQGQ